MVHQSRPDGPADASDNPALDRFRLIFERSSEAIMVIAPDGTTLDANPACRALLGHPSGEIAALRWPDIVHPEDRARARDARRPARARVT